MPKEKVLTSVCGDCGKGFENWEKNAEHVCEATGFKPTDPRHLGEDFAKISESAVKRGEERKDEEMHPAEEAEKNK